MPFREPTNQFFTEFFPRGWNRVEARSRHDDFALGLSARTADPLWALGRQWQLLELKGEEGGTPIQVELTYDEAPLNRIKLGGRPFEDIGVVPVEVLVEREAVDWDWRMRVRVGQHFERLVRLDPTLTDGAATDLIDNLRGECPIAPPPADNPKWLEMDYATRRFVALMEGRVIDGEELLKRIKRADPTLTISTELQTQFTRWYEQLYSQGDGRASAAWTPEQLDYDFRIHGTDTALPGPVHAGSYRNGSLDWDAFTLERSATRTFESRDPLQLTPVHVTFAGQPMRRWWEFEDHAVNLAALDAAKTDLGKIVLMEFALRFGDDWFVVPLTAAPNSFVKVRSLRVRDCFGQVTYVPAAREPASDPLERWEVFALAPETTGEAGADFLYVPPVSVGREESPVLEEIRFARDEDANVVFAIEHTVPNGLGDPASGFAAHLERLRRGREQLGTPAPAEAVVADEEATEPPALPPPKIEYVLATKVPANWIPFIATDALNLRAGVPEGAVKLQRAAMVSTDDADAQRLIQGLSRLLQPSETNRVDWIEEEAVGREGVRVELRRQRMRSPKGETYVWLGRKIGMGKGEARSGLRFDVVRDR